MNVIALNAPQRTKRPLTMPYDVALHYERICLNYDRKPYVALADAYSGYRDSDEDVSVSYEHGNVRTIRQ